MKLLKPVMWASLAGAVVMLVIATVTGSLGVVRAQVLLTFVALLCGSLLMQVQLGARARAAAGFSVLLSIGVAVILVSQVSFLTLVWTNWKTSTLVWRIWWISMVPSVFVTHMILLQHAATPRSGLLGHLTSFFALWAGLMILWLGLRADMFAEVSWIYLWIGAVPAAGTVGGSVYLAIRRVLRSQPGAISRRAGVAGVLMSHLVVALAAFFVGRATLGRPQHLDRGPHGMAASLAKDAAKQIDQDRYEIQSLVAEAVGDTRIVRRPPLITLPQIEKLPPRLRPGDILLERRNWYLSNPVLPGFWKHSALYIGPLEDLKRLGVTRHPAFRKHLAAYFIAAPDGRGNSVIEAVSEGVILNSLTHSLHADYVAVLRPRATDPQIAAAIIRAFENIGKPYDFDFDFQDTSRIVCTQLVCVAYEGTIDFKLVPIKGQDRLSANEVARKYAAEVGTPAQQLDFVLFLDATATSGVAFEADEAAFRASIARPGALVERP